MHAVGTGRNKKDAIKFCAVDACMKLEAMVCLIWGGGGEEEEV